MLQLGERVVSAVTHRDHILIFGDQGTILRMWWDVEYGHYMVMHEMELARG